MPNSSLLVVPPAVQAAAGVVEQCSAVVHEAFSSLGSAGLTSGCGGVAAAAFQRMLDGWLAELVRLVEESGTLAGQLTAAAGDYLRVDRFAVAGGQP